MQYGEKTHPLSFEYARRLRVMPDHVRIEGESFTAELHCRAVGEGAMTLRFASSTVADGRDYSRAVIEEPGPCLAPAAGQPRFETGAATVEVAPSALRIRTGAGFELATLDDGFGFCGERFVLNLDVSEASACYGFGERSKGLNKCGDAMEFWNVDVIAAFPNGYERADFDPNYCSIPLAILKRGPAYLGVYFDNPDRSLVDVEASAPGRLMYQCASGNPVIYLIDGPRLRDVVRRFARLTGRAPVPALWSLGYHQCRYSYEDEAEILRLRDGFQRHELPVSAFWYDIDYMDGFRLFTWNREAFPAPARLNAELKASGIRSVAIVDPGVKLEPGYGVYDEGRAREAFCKAESGRDYVGRVWPGDTVFPDFSLPEVREWWAGRLRRFMVESGLDGVWLDMNDPATGYAAGEDMRFEHGRVAHGRYRNQYALLMAEASHAALEGMAPEGRPFQLTRSGWAGIQRYAAVWTGDISSSWAHLRMSIPCSLNLGLSGVAFSGSDVGGFMGHTSPELLVRWYQAACLMPFFRNHSMKDSKTQEPWEFGPEVLRAVRGTVLTRYRLLPYLYTLFFHHHLTGDPVMRPLIYEHEGAELENVEDQFLLGEGLLVAPVVQGEGEGHAVVLRGARRQLRQVVLPQGWWYDLTNGRWIEGGRTVSHAVALDELPLFARDGAVVPWYGGPLARAPERLEEVELHVFTRERPGTLVYYADDQSTRAYRQGAFERIEVRAEAGGGTLRVEMHGQGPRGPGVRFRPVLYGAEGIRRAVLAVDGAERVEALAPASREWVCRSLDVLA